MSELLYLAEDEHHLSVRCRIPVILPLVRQEHQVQTICLTLLACR